MVAEHTLPRISKMTGKKGTSRASRKYLGGKLAGLCDEDAVALEEQLNLSHGVSGARAGL